MALLEPPPCVMCEGLPQVQVFFLEFRVQLWVFGKSPSVYGSGCEGFAFRFPTRSAACGELI